MALWRIYPAGTGTCGPRLSSTAATTSSAVLASRPRPSGTLATLGPMFLVRDPQNIVIQRMNLGFDQYNVLTTGRSSKSAQASARRSSTMMSVPHRWRRDPAAGPLARRAAEERHRYSLLRAGAGVGTQFEQRHDPHEHDGLLEYRRRGRGAAGRLYGIADRLGYGTQPQRPIKDNLSFVASDLYTEQSTSHILAEGRTASQQGASRLVPRA